MAITESSPVSMTMKNILMVVITHEMKGKQDTAENVGSEWVRNRTVAQLVAVMIDWRDDLFSTTRVR
jgi:hypothetical protein